jgi:S1-C subfamily serine protease
MLGRLLSSPRRHLSKCWVLFPRALFSRLCTKAGRKILVPDSSFDSRRMACFKPRIVEDHMKANPTISTLRVFVLASIVLTTVGLCYAKDSVSINTNPPGATVEIDGIVVGKTPYQFDVPGGYLHGSKSVFGKILRQQMHLRLALEGYLSVDSDLAKGPMPWIALNGTYHGDYWVLKTASFNFSLQKAATNFTGNVQAALGGLESIALRPSLPTEEIVRTAAPSVLMLQGSDGWGSGFLVTDTGVAVTNAHVAKGQTGLAATTANGQRFNARVEYIDPNMDLALLKLEGVNFSHLTVADLSTVRPGSSVIAIGSPSQGFQNTVTQGIVSAIGPMSNEPGTWIQTDTAINPGNSGGPLLNSVGEVIGITTQKRFESSDRRPLQGIGFALSSQDLLTVLRRFYPNMATQPRSPSSPRIGSAALLVSSDIESADIFVDDKFVGNTPSTLTLPSGTHTVRVEAANRLAWTREIELLRDSNVNLRATLVAAPAIAQTQLANSANLVPSVRSESPVMPQSVTPQAANTSLHGAEVTARASGGGAISNQEALNVKSSRSVPSILEPKDTKSSWMIKEVESSGTGAPIIMITSTPTGADIFIDSTGGFGRTPSSLEISPGKHSVQLVLNGYRDQVGEISPQAGHKLTVEVSMEK